MNSQEEKKFGDEAWGNGNYSEAIDHYSRAIMIQGNGANDQNVLKILYSNRSAAYLKVAKNPSALLDAEKCVELDVQWAKGHVRKGDALYAIGKYVESYNAYNAAIRISPSDTAVTEKRAKAERAIGSSTPPASSSSSGWGSTSSTSGTRPSPPRAAPRSGMLASMQYYCRVTVLVGCVLFLLPLPLPLSALARYKMAAAAGLISYLIALYNAHGMPKFNMEYAQLVVPDPSTMYAVICILLLTSRPYLMGMAPVLLMEFTHLVAHASMYAQSRQPQLMARAMGYIDQYLPPLIGGPNVSPDDWRRLSPASKWSQFTSKMTQSAVQFEVMQGMYLLVELLLPTRNLLMVVMWWQFLQMRYVMDRSGEVKTMFRSVDLRLSQLFAHRLCPSLIRTAYAYLKGFLAKQVEIPQPGQERPGIGSMLSKCTIM